MKKRTKRILAMLLASAMILQQGSTAGVLATETEPASETVAETQSETTAETQAPETTAETNAPETQATEAALGTTQTDTPAATQTESDAAQTQQSETVAAMQTEQPETVAETISSTQQSETVSQETTEAPAQTEEKTEAPTEAVGDDNAVSDTSSPDGLMTVGQDPVAIGLDEENRIAPIASGDIYLGTERSGSVTNVEVKTKSGNEWVTWNQNEKYPRNQDFQFRLDYSFNNAVNKPTKEKPYVYYTLPGCLEGISIPGAEGGKGAMYDESGAQIGWYSIEGNVLKFEYFDTFFDRANSDIKGYFTFDAQIKSSSSDNKKDLTVEFPGASTNPDIHFEDGKVEGDKQFGNKNADGTTDVTVTLTVTGEAAEEVTVRDILGDNLDFVENSFSLTYVLADGSTYTPPTGAEIEAALKNGGTCTLGTLPIGTYTISYKVRLKDSAKLDPTSNTVFWDWESNPDEGEKEKEATVTFQQHKFEKKDAAQQEDGTIKWEIWVTPDQFSTVLGKTVTDMLGEGQHYTGNITVSRGYHPNVFTGSIESFIQEGKFVYTFPSEGYPGSEIGDDITSSNYVGQAFRITYYTEPDNKELKREYTNSANDGGEPDDDKVDYDPSKNKEPGPEGEDKGIVEKTGIYTGVVGGTATIDWTIIVDPKEYENVENLTLEDALGNAAWLQSSFLKESLEVKKQSGETWEKFTDYSIEWTPTEIKPTGFKIKVNGEITNKIKVTIQSISENNSLIEGNWQNNTLTSTYTIGGEPGVEKEEPNIQMKGVKTGLEKAGVLDGRTATWTVTANKKEDSSNPAIDLRGDDYYIKDVLPEGMSYVEGSASYILYGDNGQVISGPTKVSPETSGDLNTLTFKFDNVGKNYIVLTYQTMIKGEISKEKSYKNTAQFGAGEKVLGEASSKVTVESTILTKKGMLAQNVLNGLHYTIQVNHAGADLFPDSDTVTLYDIMDVNTSILLNTLKAVHMITGENVKYSVRIGMTDDGQEKLTITIPDATPVTISYDVTVAGKVGESVTVTNTVKFDGELSDSATEENSVVIQKSLAGASGRQGSITLRKIDGDTLKTLAGAEFELYVINLRNTPINPEGVLFEKGTTGESGTITFPAEENKALELDQLYYFIETKAPTGYKLDEGRHYFVIKGESYSTAVEKINTLGIKFSTYAGGNTITISNEKEEKLGSLKVIKTVAGNNTDASTAFHFEVTLTNGDDPADVDGTFNGVTFEDGVATFDLQPDDSGTASKEITGLPAGLNYTVKEFTKEGENTGYTLTGTINDTGTITADKTVTATFTNTRNSANAELKVQKLYNADFPTEEAEKFSFMLTAVGNDVEPKIPTPMPEGSASEKKTVKVTDDAAVTFGEITYEKDGTYYYTIAENSGSIHGVTYDSNVYHVKVKVETDIEGTKTAAISVAKVDGVGAPKEADYQKQSGSIYIANFTNTYVADGRVSLFVQKSYNDTFPTGGKEFKFVLTAIRTTAEGVTVVPMPEGAQTTTTKTVEVTSAKPVTFGDIAYEEDGDYYYTITEVRTGTGILEGVLYDTTDYDVKVEVKTSGDTKTVVVKHKERDEDEAKWTGDTAAFTATFENYKIQNAKAVLKVQKTYIGKSDKIPTDGFSFVLEAQDGAPMPASAAGDTVTVLKSDLENATGPVEKSFGEIEYTESGTYTYTIKEAVPTGVGEDGIKDGILYDTTEYTVTVTVNDGQHGQKSVEVSYSPTGTTETSASFTNTEVEEQTDATGSVEIKAKKSMKKDADKALIPKFSFELAWAGAKGEAPEGQKLPMTAQPDADGNVKFTLPFTMDDYEAAHPEEGVEAKEFKYTLKELAEIEDEAKGIIYAENVYTVTVVIGEDISDGGKFDVTYTVDGLEGDSPLMEFVNDTTTVKVDKVDEAGNKLAGAKLQITVKDAATGESVDSWTTDDKTHEITGLLETGKTYVLEETEAPTGYAVAAPVEFTIDKDGNVFVGEEKMTDNLLTMTDAKLHFNVNKTELGTGDEVADAELTVYEKQADGTLKKVEGASWTSKKGETHDFGDLLEAGKTYVLREEVAPDGYGYVTDIEFTVEEDGSITTKMTKTADAAGNDVYLVEDAKIKLEVNKKATGTGEELDGAVLELLDKDGKVLDSWTSKKGQTHDFGSKLKAGESYTLRETVAPDGYTCVTDMKFTVAEDGTVTGLDSIKTTDTSGNTVYVVEDTLNKVSIEKVDESGAALSGAKLVVKDADSAVVDSWTTDGKAHEITGLAKGKYTLSEVEAPEGYQVSKDVPFEITGTEMVGSVLSLTMTDTKIPDSNKYSLTVTKHLRLDGVPSELAAKDVTYYVALFSDAEKTQRVSNVEKIEFHNETSSTVTFDKLAEGTYYVGETDENGTLLVSKIVNDEIIFYPEYSGDGKVELEGRDTDKVADFTNVYMKLTNDFYLSGQITVTKKILVNGEEGTSDETYYARLFTDPELTDPLDEILALDLAGNSSASVTVTNLPIGETLDSTRSYYVAETDENGNVLDPDAVTEFEISIDKSEIVLSANNSAQEVVITNSFTEEETETETETEVPKKAAPKTGDDTDFMRYLLLMALSAGICAVAFEEKRRRNRARK